MIILLFQCYIHYIINEMLNKGKCGGAGLWKKKPKKKPQIRYV
ncbi:hypothetical protein BTH41_01035 [Bacillus mycoides]|nr:hypothetical protein BTH41_01035 [Bacillus mycoides]